jgi:MFS family permease
MLPITLVVLAGCLMTGLCFGLATSLKLAAARRPDLSNEPGRGLLNAFNFLLIGLLLTASVPLDYFGVRTGFLIGCLVLSLGLALLSLSRPSGRASAQLILAGFGVGLLYLGTIELMPRGLLGEQKAAASLLFGFVLIGFGGLLAGPLLEVLMATVGYRITMLLFGILALVPMLLCYGALPEDFPQPVYNPLALLSTPTLWLAGLTFAFYTPLEAFVTVWITAYLARHDQRDHAAGWVGWFWITFLGSRILIGIFQHVYAIPDDYQPALLIVSALFAAVFLGNLLGSSSSANAIWGIIALGLVLGPVLPTLLATLPRMPNVLGAPALAIAVVHSVGALGTVVLAPLVNRSAEERTPQQALWVPLILALLMTAASLVYTFSGNVR